ncbi:MAG: hypothetical protein ACJ74F_24185 [Mycobacterium sp.]|jgi:hypothetical protein|uniref:hypothetical protein n=1 Tax=Mycobacterium sp. TaxID=1785 RepID=UPI00389A14F2
MVERIDARLRKMESPGARPGKGPTGRELAIRRQLIELFDMAYSNVEIPWEAVKQLRDISENELHLQNLINRLEDAIPPF